MQSEPGNNEAQENLNKLSSLRSSVKEANIYFDRGDYQTAEALLDQAIEVVFLWRSGL